GQLDDAGRGGGGRGALGSRGGDGRGGLDGGDRSGHLFDDGGLFGGGGLGGNGGDRGRRGAGLVRGELGLQLLVLGDGLAPLDDDLVEEVVDLIGVEAFLEPHVLELLGDDVFGGQSHGVSSFGAHCAGRYGVTRMTASRTHSA